MDQQNLRRLRERALFFKEELSRHAVLIKYWNKLSLIMKGSTARGYSDRYSDIDFVIFSDKITAPEIISNYISHGLSDREDGIFLPLNNWEGHYNLDTYEALEDKFAAGDMISVWEYSNVMILHDIDAKYEKIIQKGTKALFGGADGLIKAKYIEIQLNLDWMRQPLRRADLCASIQYAARVQEHCCQILYLLNSEGYPPAKWLFYYLKDTGASEDIRSKITDYGTVICNSAPLRPDMELGEYCLYSKMSEIVREIMGLLKKHYGSAKWIDEWYLYA